jgi:hypothetical protein
MLRISQINDPIFFIKKINSIGTIDVILNSINPRPIDRSSPTLL